MRRKKKISHRPGNKSTSEKIFRVLGQYFKTQFILMAVVSLVSWVTLRMIGVQFSILLALMTGSLSVVPILGMTVAGCIVSVIAIFDSYRFLPNVSVVFEGLVVVAVYALLNFVIDYFLSPYLVGKTTGVHPVMLLVFVVLGTFVFGVWGALLTMPAVLVIKAILSSE